MPKDSGDTRHDVRRIDTRYDFELRYWSKKLGVAPERLVEAVQKVGDAAEDVARELKQSSRH